MTLNLKPTLEEIFSTILPSSKPNKLQRTVFEILTHIPDDQRNPLIIVATPRSGKTTLMRVLTQYFFNNNPEYNILAGFSDQPHLTHSHFSLPTQQYLPTAPLRQMSGYRADLGLIDDLIADRSSCDTIIKRNRVWEWYNVHYLTRLKVNARHIIIGSIYHHDDFMSRIVNRPQLAVKNTLINLYNN